MSNMQEVAEMDKEESMSKPSSPIPSETSEGRRVLEDVFPCLSKNREPFRTLLTSSYLILHSMKDPSKIERYGMQDIFGCHTLRHQKEGPQYCSAYICFYTYPNKNKKGLLSSNVKYREKVTLVFEVKKQGYSYEANLDIATDWKNAVLGILGAKYPKWQLQEPGKSSEEGRILTGMDSRDVMDHYVRAGEPNVPLASCLAFLRRFLVILNPKSGQGKGIELFHDKIAPTLRETGVKIELLITEYAGHAQDLVIGADLSEIDGIVTVGGDGILFEVVNGLRSREDAVRVANIPVGAIAGGSGNGLARSLAGYCGESEDYLRSPITSSTLAVARGRVVQVNLAEVDVDGKKLYAFLSVGWGLLADIDVESEFLRAFGEARFTIWSFYRLAKLRSYKAKLSYIPIPTKNEDVINGNGQMDAHGPIVVDGDFNCIYSVYQSYIGPDLVFAPTAAANDGIIHLCYMRGDIGRAKATQFLISLDRGTHLDVEGVKYVPVKEFTIERQGGLDGNLTVDGEKVDCSKVRVTLSSTPLNVFSL